MISDTDVTDTYLEESDIASWLVIYADLMTLLLVFFILLYSISSLNFEKFVKS